MSLAHFARPYHPPQTKISRLNPGSVKVRYLFGWGGGGGGVGGLGAGSFRNIIRLTGINLIINNSCN